MRDDNKSETLHSIDKLKTFIDQVEEKCEISSMTQGEYKTCERVFNDIRLELDSVEDNVRYSGWNVHFIEKK